MILQKVFKGSEWLNLVRDIMLMIFEPDKEFELIIREYKERRSLRANSYSWVLTDKLAEKMLVAGVKLSKEEMHAEMIFRYGQPEIKDGQSVIISVLDGINAAEYLGRGVYAREVGQGEVNGKQFTHWRIYRGSHTYTRSEMSLFIKGIVAEAKDLGIETATPDEIARMISLIKEADDG